MTLAIGIMNETFSEKQQDKQHLLIAFGLFNGWRALKIVILNVIFVANHLQTIPHFTVYFHKQDHWFSFSVFIFHFIMHI